MSQIIIAGNPQPIEQGFNLSLRRGASGGVEYDRAWAGSPDAILSLVNTLGADASVAEVNGYAQPGSAIAVARARYASLPGDTTERVEESLTIQWASPSIELRRNPTFIGITPARIKALNDLADANGTAPSNATELAYFNLRLEGVTSYVAKLPILTYTRVAPRNTAQTINVANSGSIVPLASIPAASFFTVGEINIGQLSSGSNYVVGWMLTAEGGYLANGNSQLVETYEWGLWSTDLYDVVS